MRSPILRPLARALPWLGTAVVLALILRRVDPVETLRVLSAARPEPLVLAMLGWTIIQVASVLRWWGVERLAGDETVRLPELARSHVVGMAANLFLPGGFGGDVARAWRRRSAERSLLRAAGGVVADRFLALHALLVVAALGILSTPALQAHLTPRQLLVLLVLGSVPFGWPWWQSWRQRTDRPTGRQITATLGLWLLSVLLQLGNALVHAWLLDALWPDIPLAWMLAIIPAMSLLASLPVSVNGLGVREGLLVLWLEPVGVPAPVALALGMLSLGLLVLVGLVGGMVLLRETLSTPRSDMA